MNIYTVTEWFIKKNHDTNKWEVTLKYCFGNLVWAKHPTYLDAKNRLCAVKHFTRLEIGLNVNMLLP